jgi:hypothetical protein
LWSDAEPGAPPVSVPEGSVAELRLR